MASLVRLAKTSGASCIYYRVAKSTKPYAGDLIGWSLELGWINYSGLSGACGQCSCMGVCEFAEAVSLLILLREQAKQKNDLPNIISFASAD